MSDLTDQLEAHLESLGESTGASSSMGLANVHEGSDTPGLRGADNWIRYIIVRAMRTHYREMAGRAPATEFTAAYEQTQGIVPALRDAISQSLAAGMEIGAGTSYQVKRHTDIGRLDEVFEHKSFRRDVELRGVSQLGDTDLAHYLTERIEGSTRTLGLLSGIIEVEGPEISGKIWDVWFHSARSLAMVTYLAGLKIGKAQAETDTLDGILQATEQKEDS